MKQSLTLGAGNPGRLRGGIVTPGCGEDFDGLLAALRDQAR